MSDATIVTVVTGIVTVTTMVVGFLTLWLKLKYGVDKAEQAATKAEHAATKAASKAEVVEGKLDANTATTNAVDCKADTIVSQTNGTMNDLQALVSRIGERVEKLESYNHESYHRLLDVVHALSLKVERLLAANEARVQSPPSKDS